MDLPERDSRDLAGLGIAGQIGAEKGLELAQAAIAGTGQRIARAADLAQGDGGGPFA